MTPVSVHRICKRDGSIVLFDPQKIEVAIYKALVATGKDDRILANCLGGRVVDTLRERIGEGLPTVEGVQDIVEETLADGAAEPAPFVTVESEFSGGCPTGACPF